MRKSEMARVYVVTLLTGFIGTGSAFAFSGNGSGTPGAPYAITDVSQLQEMQDDLNAYYVLDNAIDASETLGWNGGQGFEPVGTSTNPFYGTFDGQGHTITDLHINRPTTDLVGLFGNIKSGAEVKNVGLSQVDITARRNSGSLVGHSANSAVYNSWSTGQVRGSYSGQMRLGGLMGVSSGSNTYVTQCFSEVDVTATGGAHQVGGLSGYNGHGSIMSDCYARGDVSGYIKVGGLVGDNPYPEGGYITRCYSTGKVTGSGGGLVGFNFRSGVTYDSYWDVQTSGKSSSYGGIGKTTQQMKQQATFVNWDFSGIWEIDEGQSYPYFRVQRELVGIEIVGPDEVAENSDAQYQAIAHFDDSSSKEVTVSANWSVNPNTSAQISAGTLTASDVEKDETVTLTTEYSEGGVTAIAEKEVTIRAICPDGYALNFDGVDDYVSLSGNVITNNEFTLVAWANQQGLGGGTAKTSTIFSQRNDPATDNSSTIVLATELSNTSANVFAFVRSSSGIGTQLTVPRKNYNEWHHYAITVDASDVILYIDGIEVVRGANNESGDFVTSIDYVDIGRHRHSGGNKGYFNGLIDDVRIYDRALSVEEIQANMHSRLDGIEPGLVAYWDFDEGTGQAAGDSSSNGNAGRLGSSPDADGSDPVWVESDAPVGFCFFDPWTLALQDIEQAIEDKLDAQESIQRALDKEASAMASLVELLDDPDAGGLTKSDVLSAKQKVFVATVREAHSQKDLDDSIDLLEEVLSILNGD